MLSIIIPTLNEEKYLPRLIKSINNQNFSDFEIIVSDAGSTDNTKSIATQNNATYILSNKIKHPSFQRNEGAKIAEGETLLFLDADSVLSPGFLKKSTKEFKERKLVAASFYIRFNPNKWYYNIYSYISNSIYFIKQYTKSPVGIGAGIISDKMSHELIEGFDLNVVLAEDYDYCSRINKVGKFRIIKSVKLLYSSRRIQKEGFFSSGWKWFKMGLFTLRNKKIKKQVVKYDFGKFKN